MAQNDKVSAQINAASVAEHSAMREGATEALTIEASSKRGYRAGRQIGAIATESHVARELGFTSQKGMRSARRDDPSAFLSLLLG